MKTGIGRKINEMSHRILQGTKTTKPPFKYVVLFGHEGSKYYCFHSNMADVIKGACSNITEIPFIDAGDRQLTKS
jgi:hypothetical protein